MSEFVYTLTQSVVQSITEFLPISSSGHLLIMKHVFGYEDPNLILDLVLHLGTTMAVIVFLWRNRRQMDFHFSALKWLVLWLGLATVVTGVVGMALAPVIRSFYDLRWLAFNYLILAALLLGSKWVGCLWGGRTRAQAEITVWDVLIIGAMQGLAVFPGISRSGMTIIAMLVLGFNRPFAFLFSFLVSVPAVLAASGYEFIQEYQSFQSFSPWNLMLAFSLTAILGYPLLVILRRIVITNKFYIFSVYCFLLSALLLFISMR